ncbi:hypothetical protein MPSEU_000623600 [Mayamaea pseudoterrestris]|nr:hypothetical protein MPSEU_000623600 [Mayamaea pseudoterrestris]
MTLQSCHDEGKQEYNEAEPYNPLAVFATTDSLFDDDDNYFSKKRIRTPRHWKIPTFEQQCNGVNTFTLTPDNDNEGVTVHLEHRRHSTGSDLWDAALVLAHALSRPGVVEQQQDDNEHIDAIGNDLSNSFIPNVLQGLTVLELGAGTGAVGLYAKKCLGARHVILTDLVDNLELLRRNVRANGLNGSDSQVTILPLDWSSATPVSELLENVAARMDLILGSDLFLPFASHLLQPLARTIRDLLVYSHEQNKRLQRDNVEIVKRSFPQALICYEERFDANAFFQAAANYGLHVEMVDPNLLHPVYQDAEYIHLLRITLQVNGDDAG